MLAAISGEPSDYTPCSFMLFSSLHGRCASDREYVERQLEMGLDAVAHVGHLNHTMHLTGTLHPDAQYSQWVEEQDGVKHFCRRIDTPAGPLTGRVRQRNGWPTEDAFPLMSDWIVPRAEEVLVKPEQDLEKLKYVLGPFKDSDIDVLRREAAAAKELADRHGLLLVGGWKGLQGDPGVMGCDAMAWLSGMVDVMVLSLTKPDVITEYANIIHEWNMRQIGIYLDVTEADLIIRRAWYENTEFWTPAAYRDIVAPTIRREAELVHQAGRKYGYIITTAFEPIIDDILDAGVDVLIGLDPKEGKGTDMAAVKARFAERGRATWGGVSGAMTVELGTAEETEDAVREALAVLGAGGGFILSPVDNVSGDTEQVWANTQTFIDTWQKHRA